MKKSLLFCLALCALLTGCQSSDPSQKNEAPTVQAQPLGGQDITLEVDDTRLAYYEQLVSDLQKELLELKTEIYIDRVEYESRIDALEKGSDAPIGSEQTTAAPSAELQFTYTIQNGGVTITSYTGKEKRVILPSTIDGYPVVAVGDRAFMDQTILCEVILPDSVTSIGWFAFSGCVALENVSIPASVTTICYGAFQNCRSTLTVNCAAGSYAEAYARSYGMGIKKW